MPTEDKNTTENVDGVTKSQGSHQPVKYIVLFHEPQYQQKVSNQTKQANQNLYYTNCRGKDISDKE